MQAAKELSEQVNDTPAIAKWASRYGCVAFVLLAILLFGFIRYRLRNFPLERDEGEYAYAGQLILQGIPPYQLAYNMKLPGTYAAYAAILALFGQTPAGIHVGLILANTATILLLYLLVARLFGRTTAAVAASSYAALSASPSVLGLAAHATHFVVLTAVAGVLVLFEAVERKRTSLYFLSGVLLGLSFVMKQPGIFFAVFGGFYLLYRECKPCQPKWASIIPRIGVFFAGVVLPFVLTCVLLSAAGVFDKFWFWTFTYAWEYGAIVGLAEGVGMFRQTFPSVVGPSLAIWILAGIGLTTLLWDRVARGHSVFVIALLVFSAAAVCPGLYFRAHYFIVILPAVAILAGLAVSSAVRLLLAAGHSRMIASVPMGLLVCILGYTVYLQRTMYFKTDPAVACREVYGANPFPEALKISEYIESHTAPGERIAVLGSEPEIYFYSHRHSATGYVYTYGLMEDQPYALHMQQEMIAEIEASHPAYLVTVKVATSWLKQPGSPMQIFAWGEQYLGQFELVGIADIGLSSHYVWGEAVKGYSPHSSYVVYVFKRKGHS